jgi:excisionase family DNA binding protein
MLPDTSYAEKPATSLQEFDLLTVAEVAALLHCSKAHICNVIAGRVPGCLPIPAVRLGRRKLVRRESLVSWIARNEHAANSATIRTSPERGRKSA